MKISNLIMMALLVLPGCATDWGVGLDMDDPFYSFQDRPNTIIICGSLAVTSTLNNGERINEAQFVDNYGLSFRNIQQTAVFRVRIFGYERKTKKSGFDQEGEISKYYFAFEVPKDQYELYAYTVSDQRLQVRETWSSDPEFRRKLPVGRGKFIYVGELKFTQIYSDTLIGRKLDRVAFSISDNWKEDTGELSKKFGDIGFSTSEPVVEMDGLPMRSQSSVPIIL